MGHLVGHLMGHPKNGSAGMAAATRRRPRRSRLRQSLLAEVRSMIRKTPMLVMVWFRRVFFVATPVAEPEALSSEPAPAPVEEPPPPPEPPPELAPPPPVESTIIVKPAKWVKRKGEKPKATPRPKPDPKPEPSRPQLKGEDAEQWG
jgi:hypothetical protein